MYWAHVARKDFEDAVRSKMFWGLSLLMILTAYIGLYIPQAVDSGATAEDGVAVLSGPMLLLVPIIALIVGYMALVGERETGSIRMVLSLPLKRSEVLFGKFVGRTGVVTVPILLGFVVAVPFVYALYGDFPAVDYARFVTETILTGIIFIAIAVGVSGSFDTRGKALAVVLSVFVLFEYLWEVLPLGLYYLANGEFPGDGVDPTWMEFLYNLAPSEATGSVVDALYTTSISTGQPLLVQEWVSAVVVMLWLLLPLGVGYLRFARANIG